MPKGRLGTGIGPLRRGLALPTPPACSRAATGAFTGLKPLLGRHRAGRGRTLLRSCPNQGARHAHDLSMSRSSAASGVSHRPACTGEKSHLVCAANRGVSGATAVGPPAPLGASALHDRAPRQVCADGVREDGPLGRPPGDRRSGRNPCRVLARRRARRSRLCCDTLPRCDRLAQKSPPSRTSFHRAMHQIFKHGAIRGAYNRGAHALQCAAPSAGTCIAVFVD
jgi:hypothetical protein